MEAIVIQFDIDKGFGFLKNENNEIYFFHKSNVIGVLPLVNDKVTYARVFNGKRGLQADGIQKNKTS